MSTRMDITPSRDPRGSISDDDESPQPKRGPKAAAQTHGRLTTFTACETCRTRKVKCDEERPKCGVCQRLGVKCEYREPKPTKKDKTLVFVLDSLQKIEQKLEQLLLNQQEQQTQLNAATAASVPPTTIQQQPTTATQQYPLGIGVNPYIQMNSSYSSMSYQAAGAATFGAAMSGASSMVGSSLGGMTPPAFMGGNNTPQGQKENRHLIEARKLLTWPGIRQMLSEFNIDMGIMNAQYMPAEKWLTDISEDFVDELGGGDPVKFFDPDQPHSAQRVPSGTTLITTSKIQEYTSLFFASYHCLYPILDEDQFRNETVGRAFEKKFSRYDHNTTLLLIVMGLGDVAREAIRGKQMIDETTKQQTGVRGGDKFHPPGISFIMEARNRIGHGITRMDRTVLHCYILFSLYYAQVSRNMDYWRITKMASDLCHSLVKCVGEDEWKSFNGDMMSRAYWMCVLLEGGLVTELGIPSSTLMELSVPYPDFMKPEWSASTKMTDHDLKVKFTFLAQVTLRHQMNMVDEIMKPFDGTYASIRDNFPTRAVTEAHLTSLRHWRSIIPPEINTFSSESPPPTPSTSGPSIKSQYPPLFTPRDPAHDRQQIEHLRAFWSFENPFLKINKIALPRDSTTFANIDIVLDAALRTRYKYVKYLIWRPYLYKVLHSGPNFMVSPSPQSHSGTTQKFGGGESGNPGPTAGFPYAASSKMDIPITTEDVIGALAALKNCTLWYLMHPVFKDQRRLLPHLYEYSHTMFGILLLFVAAERSSVLVCAFEAAEQGPSPFPSAYPSSSSGFGGGGGGGGGGGAFGGPQPTNNFQALQPGIERLGAEGRLEEYRYLREQMGISKECFLGWMRDMQVVHPVASWCWGTLKSVYKL